MRIHRSTPFPATPNESSTRRTSASAAVHQCRDTVPGSNYALFGTYDRRLSGACAARHFSARRHRAAPRALFESADLIFVDGPKDGHTEARILANLDTLKLAPHVVIVFDDIRVMHMVDTWRRIARPKMDLSSFGHWSGTGLIDWNGEPGR